MKNPFKRAGFDCLISAGTSISGDLVLEGGAITIVDGNVDGIIHGSSVTTKEGDKPATLIVGGQVLGMKVVKVTNVTVTGSIECDELIVDGTLAVKNGGTVAAKSIKYRSLVVEPKAVLVGTMEHLDHALQAEPSAAA